MQAWRADQALELVHPRSALRPGKLPSGIGRVAQRQFGPQRFAWVKGDRSRSIRDEVIGCEPAARVVLFAIFSKRQSRCRVAIFQKNTQFPGRLEVALEVIRDL